jgi:hypothetical protein
VEPRSDVTGLFVKEAIDHRVYVFVCGGRLRSGVKAPGDSVQARDESVALASSQHPGVRERRGPCLGERDVERPEAEVNADRTIDGVQGRVRARSETTAPELV